jgi:LmbE family N-acetylglucosaminyl deacetylase
MISIKKLKCFICTTLLVSLISCKGREEITSYAATERYPNDSLLQRDTGKKALIIIAHDDDMSAMTGTLSLLKKQGWKIKVCSFHMSKERDEAHIQACRDITDTVTFFELDYAQWRYDARKIKQDDLYLPIAKEKMNNVFNAPLIESKLINLVQEYKPSVLFTLDNDIGAYGHSEHVFISQLVLDLSKAHKLKANYIFQSVYTPHMLSSIMERHSKRMMSWGLDGGVWEKSKAVYKIINLPEPTVQINIRSEAKNKMNYLLSYNERERKTIGFFVPAFEEYSAEEYFNIFDREFFRVIKTS